MTSATTNLVADHYGWHPWPFFWIFPLLFWLVVIAGLALLVRRSSLRDSGIGALRSSFARGEISEEDYLSRLEVLRRTRRGAHP
ncbi:hypothetical protein [Nocardia nova]|uniref:hypothetical protein n=1 Tax=Nocardia nova TaxID=37330 RepID=UPI0033FC96DF